MKLSRDASSCTLERVSLTLSNRNLSSFKDSEASNQLCPFSAKIAENLLDQESVLEGNELSPIMPVPCPSVDRDLDLFHERVRACH